MTPSTIAIVISFASLCFAVFIGLKGDKRTDTKDIEERARENAKINFKLDEISSTTKDIKQDLASMREDIQKHNDKIIELESSVKQAHKRIDSVEARINRKEEAHEEHLH